LHDMATPPLIPLDWTRRGWCRICKREKELHATEEGLRCKPCLPRGWKPPNAVEWLAKYRELLEQFTKSRSIAGSYHKHGVTP